MAVFAHPDDETTAAPALAKYAAAGSKVYLVITTDGRYGVTDHSGIPAGDSLVRIRQGELECSCAALGIEPPIQLTGKDMLGSNEGMGEFFGELIKMEDQLERVIDSLRPEVILTFGPEGDSGHPDHRLTADVTTELLLSGKLAYEPSLYYFSYTEAQADKYVGWNLNYANERYLDTRITFSAEDEERYYQSIRCHQSQYSPREMEEWINLERKDPDNRVFFRRLIFEAAGVKDVLY
jgi:LmbE family N-acetylglucosaminyl deacetylase